MRQRGQPNGGRHFSVEVVLALNSEVIRWTGKKPVDAIKVKPVDTKSSGPKRSFVGEELQIVP